MCAVHSGRRCQRRPEINRISYHQQGLAQPNAHRDQSCAVAVSHVYRTSIRSRLPWRADRTADLFPARQYKSDTNPDLLLAEDQHIDRVAIDNTCYAPVDTYVLQAKSVRDGRGRILAKNDCGLTSRFLFPSGVDGFLALILPRKYRPAFWRFTPSKAAMP